MFEAARLAFSEIRLTAATKVVAGPRLSADVLAALSAIGNILSVRQLETRGTAVGEKVFIVHALELTSDQAELRGNHEPWPIRHNSLNCGMPWTVTLRLFPDGWSFQKIEYAMC